MSDFRIGIIGAGKVATVLARLWHDAGMNVAAVASRDHDRAVALASRIGAKAYDDPLALVGAVDLVMLSVPDDAIEATAQSLQATDWQGRAVIHNSGALSIDVLRILSELGAQCGSLHPAFPFADIEAALAGLPGATFAVEADSFPLRDRLLQMVAALSGHVIELPPGQKALYHAALAFSSNYTVTLYQIAERLLAEAGASPEAASAALNALLAGTLQNLREQGTPAALTGPLARADAGTIQRHLQALAANPPLPDLYRALARQTYPLLLARGVSLDDIEAVLRQDESE